VARSLHPPGKLATGDERWKSAPSEETTHDHPAGKDKRVRRRRKPLENAPGNVPEDDADPEEP
jgi:hypothetical protein